MKMVFMQYKIKNPGNQQRKSGVFAVCLSRLPHGISAVYVLRGPDSNQGDEIMTLVGDHYPTPPCYRLHYPDRRLFAFRSGCNLCPADDADIPIFDQPFIMGMIGGQDLNLILVVRLTPVACLSHPRVPTTPPPILPVTLSGSPSRGEPCGLRRCAIFCKSATRLPAAL
jgi:hypothetical protein